jgi:hypothetical protein
LDFTELNPSAPVAMFMQEMNERKSLSLDDFEVCLPNLACYFKNTQFEMASKWQDVFGPAETFFRRLWGLTGTHLASGSGKGDSSSSSSGGKSSNKQSAMEKGVSNTGGGSSSSAAIQLPQIGDLFHTMTSVLRMPGVLNNRMVLDPLAKLLSYSLQNCTSISFVQLVALCHYCNRGFIKERDKQMLTRTAVFELVQAIKFKTAIPNTNFLMLTNLVLSDAGGAISIGTETDSAFPKVLTNYNLT